MSTSPENLDKLEAALDKLERNTNKLLGHLEAKRSEAEVLSNLTSRQRQVLELMAVGCDNREIAAALRISTHS